MLQITQKNIGPLSMIVVGVAIGIASLQPQPAQAGNHDRDVTYKVKEQEVIKNSYPVPASAARELEVDNVFGSVEVVGTSGYQVELVVNKTLWAESDAKMANAKKEVTLDVKQDGDVLRMYVNGPFRCNCDGGCNNWGRDPGYTVKMDLQLRVPNRMKFKLKTVNDGNIKVQGVAGDFIVRNVNGSIAMSEVAGSGAATTVNGAVTVTFREGTPMTEQHQSVSRREALRRGALVAGATVWVAPTVQAIAARLPSNAEAAPSANPVKCQSGCKTVGRTRRARTSSSNSARWRFSCSAMRRISSRVRPRPATASWPS